MDRTSTANIDYTRLTKAIKAQALALGFQQVGVTDTDLGEHETHFLNWLDKGHHGEMDYMQRHGTKRSRPADLEPGTLRIISVRMDYFPADVDDAWEVIGDSQRAFVSRYALGRDYHKLIRKRLQKLADFITEQTVDFSYRVFVDSAPVLEKALSEKAGLGWIGKHSNLLNKTSGSWFFLGELYTNLPLSIDEPHRENHCGRCTACIDACPTRAIVAPYQVDARRCISYLTIELRSSIPVDLRAAMGNRIYGCDDCQLVCPWNRFSDNTAETDFSPRHNLDQATLTELFSWSETEFLQRFEGSPIRRIGYQCWLRNIAVALGNFIGTGKEGTDSAVLALESRAGRESEMVNEHISWALHQHPENQ